MRRPKMVVLGTAKEGCTSGATTFVARLVKDQYSESTTSTIGFDLQRYLLPVNDSQGSDQVTVDIWDIACQPKYESVMSGYLNKTNIAIICFDLSEPLDRNLNYQQMLSFLEPAPTIMLIGTKSDNAREGAIQELKELATELGKRVFITSAKKNEGFEEVRTYIAETCRSLATVQSRQPDDMSPMPSRTPSKPISAGLLMSILNAKYTKTVGCLMAAAGLLALGIGLTVFCPPVTALLVGIGIALAQTAGVALIAGGAVSLFAGAGLAFFAKNKANTTETRPAIRSAFGDV
jgi:GTPase SAR1 family protein